MIIALHARVRTHVRTRTHTHTRARARAHTHTLFHHSKEIQYKCSNAQKSWGFIYKRRNKKKKRVSWSNEHTSVWLQEDAATGDSSSGHGLAGNGSGRRNSHPPPTPRSILPRVSAPQQRDSTGPGRGLEGSRLRGGSTVRLLDRLAQIDFREGYVRI